ANVSQPSNIGKITTDGVAHEIPIVDSNGIAVSNAYPGGIAAGPDGTLWFTEGRGNIVRFDPSVADRNKAFTSYPIPGGGSPTARVYVFDQGRGNLAAYFTARRNNASGTFAGDGTTTESPTERSHTMPAPQSLPAWA